MSLGLVTRDQSYQNIQTKTVHTCTGIVDAPQAKVCDLATIDLNTTDLIVDQLQVNTIENLTTQQPQDQYILIMASNTFAPDRLLSVSGDTIDLGWTVHQIYVEVDGVWSSLLTSPVASVRQPANQYTAIPGSSQIEIVAEFLDFLEYVFVSTGIQDSHGFRVIGPEHTTTSTSAAQKNEFRIGVSRTEPNIVDNYVLYIERGPLNQDFYLYFLDGSVITGNPPGTSLVYHDLGTGTPPTGLPDNPSFLPAPFVILPNYSDSVIRRYYLFRK